MTLLLGLAVSLESAEPGPRFGNLGAEDGLSSNWVLAVLRDSRGFLWVGTQNGLNRYDGHAFVVYSASDQDPHSIPSPVAGVLFEDTRGRLWVGSRWGAEGMARYDRDRDHFVRLPHGPGSGGLSDARVNAIAEDSEGRLWVGTRHGVERVDPETGTYEVFAFGQLEPGREPPRMVVSLLSSRSGRLWVGTTEGMFVYEPRQKLCVPWSGGLSSTAGGRNAVEGGGGREAVELRGARIEEMLEDHAGTVWVATISDGLFEIHPEQETLRQHRPVPDDPTSLSHSRVRCLAQDAEGHVWVGSENGGLNRLDRRTGRFHRHLPDHLDPRALGSASIYSLHSDSQGILWVGTYNDGLSYISPSEQRFGLVTASPRGLKDRHVGALMEDRHGNLWIGTDGGGLARVDASSGRYSHFVHEQEDPESIGSNSVLTLSEDDAGDVWVGGWEGGLSRLDPATGRARRFRHDPDDATSIIGNDVWRVRPLPSGELLVATQQGPDLFDPRSETFTRLSGRFPGIQDSMTLSLEVTASGDFWIGQSGRAQHVALATGKVTSYEHAPEGSSQLPSGMVFAILEDSGGNTWIGTERGLLCLPSSIPLGSDLLRVEGLPHETVTNVLEDSSGSIWATSHRGLSRLTNAVRSPRQPSLVHFDVHDGLQGNEFTGGAALEGRDGRLYFGGPRGFNVFRPEAIRLNESPPPVVLTDLRIFNRSVSVAGPDSPLERSIVETQAITVSQDQFVLTFQFAALNMDLPEKNRYAYLLEGLESDWNEVGTRREATYTQLRPRDYVLRVRAANNDGLWNEDGLSLRVTVLPRWYERWWARLALAIAASLMIAAAYRRRVRALRARELELSRRVEDRTQALNRLNEELEQRVSERTQELEEEKERLKVTLRSIGDGVIATDVESRVVLLNRVAEQITGWRTAKARGRPLREILPLFDVATREPQESPVAAVLDDEGGWSPPLHSLLARPDGVEKLLSQSVAPIREQESRTVGAVLVLRDVTNQRKVEEQLQNSQKLEALGILAGGIAHDFNNLLTGVFGYLDVMKQRWANRPQETNTLEKALAVLEKARGLTGQLLTFSRGGEPVTAPIDLGDLLRKSIDFALSGSNAVGELRVAEDLWACQGDRRQVDQVVDNLLLNARQAMRWGGVVEVTAENVTVTQELQLPIVPGRYVCVTVSDEGVGIPSELRSRVFEPFFSTKSDGTGLGLATSYSIVRKHGGHLAVSSELDEGARFVVYLPASERSARSDPETPRDASTPRRRVLVMDDEAFVRDVACKLLEVLGHTGEAVSDAAGAVDAFRRARESGRPFDLVMLDLTIHGGPGGLAVLPRLREIDPQVRAVASSGYSGDPVMADPEGHGFVAQLAKPYVAEDLQQLLSRVFGTHRDG